MHSYTVNTPPIVDILQTLSNETIWFRIPLFRDKIMKHIKRKIRWQNSTWTLTIAGVTPTLIDKWFGKLDGIKKKGSTCRLYYDDKHDRFNSFQNGKYVCKWLLDCMVNKGLVWIIYYKGSEYRPLMRKIRKFGTEKLMLSGIIKVKRCGCDVWTRF